MMTCALSAKDDRTGQRTENGFLSSLLYRLTSCPQVNVMTVNPVFTSIQDMDLMVSRWEWVLGK